MDKLSKSLEVLKILSTTTSEPLTTSNEKYTINFISFNNFIYTIFFS